MIGTNGQSGKKKGIATVETDSFDLLIIQTTPFCNLDCDYCYLPNRSNSQVMQKNVLETTLERAFNFMKLGRQLTIVWHAGEPLAVPISFYEHATELIDRLKPKDCAVTQSFQTNGVLVSADWCRYFAKTRSRVGLSLDGPSFVHDQQRKYRSGRGSHAEVMRAIERLKAHNQSFHVISVVTNASLAHASDIYSFAKEVGCDSWAFNIETLEGTNRRRSFASRESDEDLRAFIRTLFGLWLNDGNRLRIREFDGLLGVLGRGWADRRQESCVGCIINVDVNGAFSTYSPELLGQHTHHGRFAFGEVHLDSIEEAFHSDRFRKVRLEIDAGVERCQTTCEYFAFCGGGSPGAKFFETGSFDVTSTRSCETRIKIVVDSVFDVLDAALPAAELQNTTSIL